MTRVRPDEVRSVEIGFRSDPKAAGLPGGMAWSSPHGGEGLRRIPDEAVMITGDGNLLELQATVRYTIAKPRVYLFEVGDPEAILRARRRVGAARGGRRPAVPRAADLAAARR